MQNATLANTTLFECSNMLIYSQINSAVFALARLVLPSLGRFTRNKK